MDRYTAVVAIAGGARSRCDRCKCRHAAKKEGSSLTFRVEGDYRIGARLAPRLAQDIADGGLGSALTKLLEAAVSESTSDVNVASLMSNPVRVEGAVGAALAASGIAVERLSVRSDIADTMLVRQRTEEARSRKRPMSGTNSSSSVSTARTGISSSLSPVGAACQTLRD